MLNRNGVDNPGTAGDVAERWLRRIMKTMMPECCLSLSSDFRVWPLQTKRLMYQQLITILSPFCGSKDNIRDAARTVIVHPVAMPLHHQLDLPSIIMKTKGLLLWPISE